MCVAFRFHIISSAIQILYIPEKNQQQQSTREQQRQQQINPRTTTTIYKTKLPHTHLLCYCVWTVDSFHFARAIPHTHTHSYIHSFTHSPIRPVARLFVCTLIHFAISTRLHTLKKSVVAFLSSLPSSTTRLCYFCFAL